MTDKEIRDALTEIDEDDDAGVSSWEAQFLQSILFDYKGPLSDSQREKSLEILEQYG